MKLKFGPSPIDHFALVARALAQVCLNHNLELMFGSEWKDPEKISPDISSLWKTKWEGVEETLGVMQEMQREINRLKILDV